MTTSALAPSFKPGAFPGSLPLHQARENGGFPPSYDRLWSRLKERLGDKAGTRQLIEVLLLHRHHGRPVVRQAVEQALALGAIDAGAVALFARHLETRADEQPVQLSLSDLGQLSAPPHPEGLRMLVASLLDEGVAFEHLERMLKHHPAKLLGLD